MKGRNRDVAKTSVYCRNCEIRLRSIFFEAISDLRMSEQRDLPESMAWRVIGRLESGQTKRVHGHSESRQKCCCKDVESIQKITQNVRRRPGAGRPRATTSSYDRYKQLTARRNRTERMLRNCIKTVALGNRTKGVEKPNST
ncbi:hypothetical protein TNCV_2275541 [Trichonephila clavipes]|nr:hypothetical protein TNCV_2275541 [Trichonephila clavipes]